MIDRVPWLDGKPFYLGATSWNKDVIEWRDNEPFDSKVTFAGYERMRSGHRIVFHVEHFGLDVGASMREAEVIIPHLNRGWMRGRWCFIKKGSIYSLHLLENYPLISTIVLYDGSSGRVVDDTRAG